LVILVTLDVKNLFEAGRGCLWLRVAGYWGTGLSLTILTNKIKRPLASRVSRFEGVEWALVLSGSRVRRVVQIRRLFCQLAVKKFGYSGAGVARYLGTATSSVTRLANSPELPAFYSPEYAI
jgi:hypothetical protein